MTEGTPHAAEPPDDVGADGQWSEPATTGTPRWAKVFRIVLAVGVVLFVTVRFAVFGGH